MCDIFCSCLRRRVGFFFNETARQALRDESSSWTFSSFRIFSRRAKVMISGIIISLFDRKNRLKVHSFLICRNRFRSRSYQNLVNSTMRNIATKYRIFSSTKLAVACAVSITHSGKFFSHHVGGARFAGSGKLVLLI